MNNILHADFRTLPIEPGSVDLIATDPPYQKEHLPLWEDLGKWAEKVLAPEGCLISYSGKFLLPEVLTILGRYLSYQHTIVTAYPTHRKQWQNRGTIGSTFWLTSWKPVVVFSRPGWKPNKVTKDVIQGNGYNKRWHKWQQGLNEAIYLVERFSERSDLVADPFGGGFTFAQACKLLGRKCVSCDIDAQAVAKGRYRLTTTNE